MPETIGPMIFSSVQIAATPIVPGADHARLLLEGGADKRFKVAADLRRKGNVLRPVRDDDRPR